MKSIPGLEALKILTWSDDKYYGRGMPGAV